jgi:hypothetical protein
MDGEQFAAVATLGHSSHRGSFIYAVDKTAVGLKVQDLVKTGRVAVFGCGDCARCVCGPRSSDYGHAQDKPLHSSTPLFVLSYLGPDLIA